MHMNNPHVPVKAWAHAYRENDDLLIRKRSLFSSISRTVPDKVFTVFTPSLLPEETGRELEGSVNMLCLTGSLGEGRA